MDEKMDDYIKRKDALIAASEDEGFGIAIRRRIRQISAADVRENVHGEWKHRKSWEFYVCSVCSVEVELMNKNMNFCHNCGADMR